MNRRNTLAQILAVTAAALALPIAAQAQQARELNFGIISTESSANLKSTWLPVLEDLEKATGLKVKAYFAPDYAGVIEAMRFNKVQVGWFGNKSAMEAVDRAQGEVFARMVQPDGGTGYWSQMIVHKDSPLNNLQDVLKARQTLNFGLGDPNSTSGSLVPGYYAFQLNGVDPTRDFKRTVRANHETNILTVVNRQLDAAVVASDAMERMKLKMPEKHADLRVVWTSPLIPSDPLVMRGDVDPAVKKQLRDFFVGYGKDAREKAILAQLTVSGFQASDNSQLLPIRQLELVRERNKVEADTALAADEKAKKLKDIDARLAELGRQTASAR
ncbi:phosphonate ABC transporter substrate-binding protein [Leptothrix discophora]|uniref:Phosphonate ABC transporter substrate-binding protein n=1 Tax=Leptothrix discophora TaxID=89 RepID=A0ABT9G6R5_LEPDI|nr:phosphonate ABC transporter substrate-binding protein [Leptothrix discophora]MDP4302096.1 phosphonate ABC transporter substrate-binding protein [Leptothrix discophora]